MHRQHATGAAVCRRRSVAATVTAGDGLEGWRRATSIRPRRCRNTKWGICFNRPRYRGGDGPSATCGDAGDGGDGGD